MILFDSIRLSGLTDLDLPIFGVRVTDPFQVTNVNGLGAPELQVELADAHNSGGVFMSRRAQGRQVVIRVGLNPDYKIGQTVGDLRHSLYGLLSPRTSAADQSMTVSLLLRNVPVAQTTGYVSRIEIVPFNQTPEAQITIECLGPYLESPEVTSYLDDIPDTATWTLDNVGLAPTGINFEVTLDVAVPTFTIQILNSDRMDFSYSTGFQVGDRLIVDTNEATRFVGLERSASYIAYLEILSGDSNWLTLYGGSHTFQTTDPVNFTWDKFEYRTKYWGI